MSIKQALTWIAVCALILVLSTLFLDNYFPGNQALRYKTTGYLWALILAGFAIFLMVKAYTKCTIPKMYLQKVLLGISVFLVFPGLLGIFPGMFTLFTYLAKPSGICFSQYLTYFWPLVVIGAALFVIDFFWADYTQHHPS